MYFPIIPFSHFISEAWIRVRNRQEALLCWDRGQAVPQCLTVGAPTSAAARGEWLPVFSPLKGG